MLALNKTPLLWSNRFVAVATGGQKSFRLLNQVTPQCCYVFCNVCCWVASC